jgi:hypothetical protein
MLHDPDILPEPNRFYPERNSSFLLPGCLCRVLVLAEVYIRVTTSHRCPLVTPMHSSLRLHIVTPFFASDEDAQYPLALDVLLRKNTGPNIIAL